MDERGKRRARSHMGDAQRVDPLGDRALRAAPTHIDPEMTPPPMEPARPESVPGYQTLAPPIRDQFVMMSDEIAKLSAALGRVWDARDVAPQLERLEKKVDGYVHDVVEQGERLRGFVDPAIKGMMAKLDVVTSQHDRNHGRIEQFFDKDLERVLSAIEKLDKRLDDFAERINHLGRSIDALNLTVGGVVARVTAVEAIGTSHEVRLSTLEQASKLNNALVVKRNGLIKAAWGAVVAVGGAVAGYLAGGCT